MDPELAALFARNLQRAIKDAGTNQNQLAKAVGLKRATVGTYFHGRSLPSVEALVRIAKALGVSTDRLLGVSRRS
jgi:transcriptional regulator with XRE-family HTH domain